MQIEAVDFFYLAMPDVTDEADGSQDALLVRVAAGGHTGWGECEAAPLPSIAAFVCPKSHGVCRPVSDSVLGKPLRDQADIARISSDVAYNSMDLLQAPHTVSGIEMALWDLLGQARGEPVWRLLGYRRSYPKTPYASVLFGDTPQETLARAKEMRARNFIAAKFGWVRSVAAMHGRTRSILPPPAKGSAMTVCCWSIPARFSSTMSRARRSACRRSKRHARSGSRSRSRRARSKHTARWRSEARQ
jgi:L-alanine-DL-glutamate epimerase-like enolase superfamily enzyme